MTTVVERRLQNQLISRSGLRRPADVVSWFGAVQAQEYEVAKWGLALRLRGAPDNQAIERAFTDGEMLRTHVLRPTWHFVTPADIRWMLELTAPRVHARMATYERQLGLDIPLRLRATSVFERALRDGQHRTRGELGDALRDAGIVFDHIRLAHTAMFAELEGVICSGPRRGKQFTYALVAERAPNAVRMARDEALATLAERFFRSHGPATIRDFVWWSGLITADAKRGLEIARARREEVDGHTFWTVPAAKRGTTRDDVAYLLPIYDEYLVAYRDRVAVPHGPATFAWAAKGTTVTFQNPVVIDGQVAGTWRLARKGKDAAITIVPLRRLTRRDRESLATAVARFKRFVGDSVDWSIAGGRD